MKSRRDLTCQGVKIQHGERDGLYQSYYDNGNPLLEVTYTNGVFHGEVHIYPKVPGPGKIITVKTYENGKLVTTDSILCDHPQ